MNTTRYDFSNRTVLVTGAASGIGLGTATAFARAGAKLIATDINEDALERQRDAYGAGARVCPMDAGDEAAIHRIASDLTTAGEALDVVVNNAGAAVLEPIAALQDDAMEMQWRVLLKGPMLCVKHFAPLMQDRASASFINIASIAAIIQATNHAVYCACKAGLTKFTKDALKEYPSLRFNTVQPGFIDTPILRVYGEGEALEATKKDLASRTPAGRLGTADDIAEACLFLASDGASFVNGATLVVDGGVTSANALEFL